MRAYIFVLCILCGIFLNVDGYKAGVVVSPNNDVTHVLPLVYKVGKENVDILLLPSGIAGAEDNYDETVKDLSKAAKQAGVFLVASLKENTVCQKQPETVRSNIVFDRQGAIVAVSRKPISNIANCTTTGPTTFTTDFGVFHLKMEDDLVLQPLEDGKNYVVAGAWPSQIPLLSGAKFLKSWAYTADVNVVSSHGLFAGKAGLKSRTSGDLVMADLDNHEEKLSSPPAVNPSLQKFPTEDLSQYIIRPLDVEASIKGYKHRVCHNTFCCEFNVKTSWRGSKQECNYGLAAFDGSLHYGAGHYIGSQNCAVFACAGLYKRTCNFSSENNNTNIAFEKLTIKADFVKHSAQYPVILTNEIVASDQFNFVTKSDRNSKQVTIELSDSKNILAFGIFGRNFEKDYDILIKQNGDQNFDGICDYIFNENVVEFFDYVWIRLRILLVIVSIYVLEMM